ncbi:MAG TPA: hypothetical protein VNZ64_22085, partial [Candidatus Acidoferrum sp.]|nr:hypothetical protein [Candidatus Acidoferrum sp.]
LFLLLRRPARILIHDCREHAFAVALLVRRPSQTSPLSVPICNHPRPKSHYLHFTCRLLKDRPLFCRISSSGMKCLANNRQQNDDVQRLGLVRMLHPRENLVAAAAVAQASKPAVSPTSKSALRRTRAGSAGLETCAALADRFAPRNDFNLRVVPRGDGSPPGQMEQGGL